MSLKNRNAVVTGSTSGIGLAYAKALAGEGVNVMINGLGKPDDIEKERAGIEGQFRVRALYSAADMTKPDQIAGMIEEAASQFDGVDILINNAGVQFVSPIEDFPVERWDQIIAINLSSAFHAIRAVTPIMKKGGWGRIINTASAHSLVASPFKSAYVAAKHGLVGLTKTAALELATLQDHRQLHLAWLRLDAAGGEPDPRRHEGAGNDPGARDQRRAARLPADQGVRHRRTGGGDRGIPVLGRRRPDHRSQYFGGWRLDGGMTLVRAPGR
jgi:NADP-dependent 3-hydroxy acid dehydrogenase YdfG